MKSNAHIHTADCTTTFLLQHNSFGLQPVDSQLHKLHSEHFEF